MPTELIEEGSGQLPAPQWRSAPMTPGATMLSFDPALALEIGDTKAIVLQKIWDWMEYNRFKNRQDHLIDGQWYTYNSAKQWRDNHFPYLSVATVKATFQKLEEEGYIKRIQPLKEYGDCRMWVTIPADARARIDAISAANTPDKKTPRGDKNVTRGAENTTPPVEKDSPTIEESSKDESSILNTQSLTTTVLQATSVVDDDQLRRDPEAESGEHILNGEGRDTTAVKAFVPHEQHRDEEPISKVPPKVLPVAADLEAFGVLPITAQRLAREYSEDEIRHVMHCASLLDLGNPPGFVVAKLDTGQGWALRPLVSRASTLALSSAIDGDGHTVLTSHFVLDVEALRRENARMAAEDAGVGSQ